MTTSRKHEPWDGFLTPSPAPAIVIDPQVFAGKRVLITGAGGYIGSALARALGRLALDQLVLLDAAEFGLYQLEQDLQAAVYVVGSVCDEALVRELFALHRFDLVFHAAALKHVPLMESNPLAAVETNGMGADVIAKAAAEQNVERLVLLSTDKAVDPISIMGASKRLAELIALANASATTMVAVRLCNVLGSSGSVAPRFVEQIRRGAPVTVTHPQATRYFLSLEETVQLLLLAASTSTGTELVIPKLGSPTKIVDLARFLIDESKNEILYTQLRPGDKLHETMLSARENLRMETSAAALLTVASPSLHPVQLRGILARLRESLRLRDRHALLEALCEAVPEYQP